MVEWDDNDWLERVARAMCAGFGCEWDGEGFLRPDDYRCLATAAIKALEPTWRVQLTPAGVAFRDARDKARASRRAMINAAPKD